MNSVCSENVRHSLVTPKTSIEQRSSFSTNRWHDNRVVINVGGVKYETYKTTLKNIPDTRLSWLTDSSPDNWDPITGEFFFDRHPGVFNMILNYYRTGRLHAPMDVCGPLFEEELAFWGIDENEIEPCCWAIYRTHRNAQETLAEFDGENNECDDDDDDDEGVNVAERFGIIEEQTGKEKSAWQTWKLKCWKLLDDPKSSVAAKTYAVISVLFIVASISVFCLETHILFRVTVKPNTTIYNLSVRETEKQTRPQQFLVVAEYVCITFFTCELICRIVCCPMLLDYIKQPFNWIDFLSITPFYISLLVSQLNQDMGTSDSIHFLNSLRLIRIFRILKLTRHVSGLKILGHTLKASAKELFLLILVLIIGVLIFACLIYYAEQVDEGSKNSFTNIPIGFWWALVTMTTLGYGDMIPRTALGYIVGTICAVCGLLMLSLPVPVIVSNFTLYYSHAQARMKLLKRPKRSLIGAANALKEQGSIRSRSSSGDDSPRGSCSSITSTKDKQSNDSALESGESKSGSPQKDKTCISVIFVDELMKPKDTPHRLDRKFHHPPSSIIEKVQNLTYNSRRSRRRVRPVVNTVTSGASRRRSLFPYSIPEDTAWSNDDEVN